MKTFMFLTPATNSGDKRNITQFGLFNPFKTYVVTMLVRSAATRPNVTKNHLSYVDIKIVTALLCTS